MSQQNSITSFSLVRNNQIWANDRLVFEKPADLPPAEFFNTAYEALQINYPKFFKMDNLCKTGFLATEVLLKDRRLSEKYGPEQTGIVFSTSNSSLDTDMRFYESMAEAPSPALFVYTLPNIVLGEICIRQKIKGESACFVFDIFDFAFQADYINTLLNSGKTEACISGWADFYGESFEAAFYLVERTEKEEDLIHNAENCGKIYQRQWSHSPQP